MTAVAHRTNVTVTAIVVTHDSADVLCICLDALKSAGVSIIVVDNASTDNTASIAEAYGVRVIAAPFNEGYGRANNRGIAAANDAGWCLIVNPDLVVERDTVTRLQVIAERHAGAGMIVPVIIEHSGRIFDHDQTLLSPVSPPLPAAADSADPTIHEVAFASGACMLVRREAFESVGGFDPEIFLFYEDDDLCQRLRQAGWRILKTNDVNVRHARGGSVASKPGRQYHSRYHQAWSRCYVASKHGVAAGLVPFLLAQGLKALAAYATFNRRRIERQGGSMAGALAALRGRSAFENDPPGL